MTEQFEKSSKKDYTIFIRNIPYETDRDQLRDFLEQTLSKSDDDDGDDNNNHASIPMWMVMNQKQNKRIKSVHIAKDADTGQSRGYAFVEFYMALAAKEAVKKINGAVLEGKKLHAMTQDERKNSRSAAEDGGDDGNNKTAVKEVVVRGLPRKYDIKKTEQLLRAKFSSVGVIVNIRIPADKRKRVNAKKGGRRDTIAPENARHMGYAFIQFKKAKSAEFAVIHHNDKPLHKGDTSALTVDLKLKREEYLAISEKIKNVIQQKAGMQDDDSDDSGDDNNKKKKKKKSGKSRAANDDDDGDDSEDFDLDEFDDIDLGDDFKIKNDLDEDFDEDDQNDDDNIDEESEEEDEEDDEEDDMKKKKRAQGHLRDVHNTVFMNNLSFDVDYEELLTLFQNRYGPVLYLSLVKNSKTNLCRGSAFLRFRQKASYDRLMQDLHTAERLMELELQSDPAMHRAAARRPVIPDLSIDGRSIHIQSALPRDEMDRKKSRDEMDRLKQKDRRNLKLADVGISALDEEEFSDDVKKRVRLSFRQKRKLLNEKNHIFVSPVRLCVHFIPGSLSSNKMRQMFMDAVMKNENVVAKHGKPRIVQCTIVREDSARKNAMRFGFVEFTVHEHAMSALEAINGKDGILSPSVKGRRRRSTNRLFCEFALSDVFKLKRLEKSKQMGASNTQKQKEEAQKAREERQDMEDTSDGDDDDVGEYDKVFRDDDEEKEEEEEREEQIKAKTGKKDAKKNKKRKMQMDETVDSTEKEEEQIKAKTGKKDAKKRKAWSRSKKNKKRKMQTESDETMDRTEKKEKQKRQVTPPAKAESEDIVSQQPHKKRRKFFSRSSDPKNSS